MLVGILFPPGVSFALELGFEGILSATVSDNVDNDNAGSESYGTVGFASFEVFGEHSSRRVTGGFEGLLETRRQFDESATTSEFGSITSFYGAATARLTPRTFSWYFGDVLGGVLERDQLRSIDSAITRRRNVFVTGPESAYEIDSFRRLSTRLYYIHQSDDTGDELPRLYNFQSRYEVDASGGHQWGIAVSDVLADNPDRGVKADFNRLSASAFWQRRRGLLSSLLELGVTQYDTDAEQLNGLNARAEITRSLSQLSRVRFSIHQDLRDQTLNDFESLIGTGSTRDRTDGIFTETFASVSYELESGPNRFAWTLGASDSDFQRLSSDAGFSRDTAAGQNRRDYFSILELSRALNRRWAISFDAFVGREDFINDPQETDSIVSGVTLQYALRYDWQLLAGLRHAAEEGTERRLLNDQIVEQSFERTENQFTVGIRWVPPTHASRQQTLRLKSLVD